MAKKTRAANQAEAQPALNYSRSESYVSTYSNNVAYVVSPIDVSLVFGQVLDGNQERINIEQKARITLPLVQAKILAAMLVQQIEAYEEKFGEIKIPSQINTTPRSIDQAL